MAKKSKIVANGRREVIVARHKVRRDAFRAATKDVSRPIEERIAAGRELSRLPRDSSPARLRNRDQSDGRPRGYLRKVGLSRVNFRALAHRGELPGITKSSW